MISIDFLKSSRAGIEFIDFQTTRFYDILSTAVEKNITLVNGKSVLGKDVAKDILPIIEEFTGFKNITVKLEEKGNLAVDTGYFSPHHVFNNEGTDQLMGITKTTLYRWFAENKVKLFKGSIDYSTGKVSGSFATIPVNLHINVNLSVPFEPEKVAKYGVPIHGIIAGAIAHELGHVFGGCMMIYTAASDNLVAKAALQFYKKAEREEDRVMVLKDTASILELDPAKIAELQAIAQNPNEEAFVLYWNKLTVQRNSRRSLSVGVERMSSEVVADMYAIRMGCDKGIIAVISAFIDIGAITHVVNSLISAALFTIIIEMLMTPGIALTLAAGGGILPFTIFSGCLFTTLFVCEYFSKGYSSVYNADHRRFEDALRQMVAKIKEDKGVGSAEKAELVKTVDQMLELNKKFKPWYDNTVIQRAMGWVFNGGDFKLQEIEHYTQVLSNHELNVFAVKLAALKERRDPEALPA
jgi:hypothetical protein